MVSVPDEYPFEFLFNANSLPSKVLFEGKSVGSPDGIVGGQIDKVPIGLEIKEFGHGHILSVLSKPVRSLSVGVAGT